MVTDHLQCPTQVSIARIYNFDVAKRKHSEKKPSSS